MTPEIIGYLAKSTTIILIVGNLIGLFYYCLNRLNSQSKSITVYLILMLAVDITSLLLAYVFSNNNLIVLHIYSFTELAFMIYFFKRYMFRTKQRFLTALGITGLAYILFEMLSIFVIKGLIVKDFSPFAKVVDNFLIILFALAFMSEKMSRFREQEWGNFRLNIVFLIFYTLNTTLFFLPFNFMVNASVNVKYYFFAGNISFLILYYLYLTFEILRNGLKGAPAPALRK